MKIARYFTPALLVIITFYSAPTLAEDHPQDVLPQYQYVANPDPVSQVERAKAQALAQDKTLLVVMGANWCHDSRALAGQFSKPQVHAVLESHFVTQFVDVGYYNDLRPVTALLDYPGYFATPTVLAVDPTSGQLLNRDDVRRWQAAANLETEDFVEGLTNYAQRESANNPARSTQVKAFEETQTARLQQAFGILGPMLKAFDEDTLADRQQFEDTWREVRDFRNQLQLDLQDVWSGAKQVSELSADTPFSWE